MASSNLMIARKASQGNVTATEAAATNPTTLPPRLYPPGITAPIVPTGTAPTCTVNVMDSADGTTFAALDDPRSKVLNPAAKTSAFIRSVRIVRWANGAAGGNVGVQLVVGGTTPSFGAVTLQWY